VLCEQNTVPGITTRMLLPLARRVYVSFDDTAGRMDTRKRRLTGNPVRGRILAAADAPPRPTDNPTVLVVGGSQGAHAINTAMVAALAHLDRPDRLRFIHQTGVRDRDTVADAYRDAGVTAEVQAFFHDMAARYRQADLVICRAGATTVAELTVLGKPALLIPYPFAADNHQERNAASMVARGAAQMIRERDLSGADLARRLEHLAGAPHELAAMASRSRRLGKPEAARRIVDDCYRLLGPEPCI
jgi:UDP-N-acetylglucosamine--N-acetylmuramyl-(pentapeptide) pyrophosphoryl-undecaprenol N-acetylglucosamine transferase